MKRYGKPPSFRVRTEAGTNIDVTIVGIIIIGDIVDWTVIDEEIVRADNAISFIIETQTNIREGKEKPRHNINKRKGNKFKQNLRLQQIENNCYLNNLTTKLEPATEEEIRKSAPKIKCYV